MPPCGGFTLGSPCKFTHDVYDFIDEESNCQECGKGYDDDTEAERKTWIGCDRCWRWFHHGSTMAASDIRGNHQRKQFLNVESVKLRNKINHKLRNITF